MCVNCVTLITTEPDLKNRVFMSVHVISPRIVSHFKRQTIVISQDRWNELTAFCVRAGTPRGEGGRGVTARGPGRPNHVNYFTIHCLLSVR